MHRNSQYLYALGVMCIAPLLMGLGVGETSNHNEELKPALDAYEDFRKEGCVSITRKKLAPVTKHRPDIDTIEVWGKGSGLPVNALRALIQRLLWWLACNYRLIHLNLGKMALN